MLTTDSYKGTNKKRTVQQLVRKNFWLQLSNSRRKNWCVAIKSVILQKKLIYHGYY